MPRPETPIDWNKANKLLLAGCPGSEVAAYFGMHPDTFYRRVEEKYKMGFTAYRQQKFFMGNSFLREKQYDVALEGDKAMLVWLGKQRLDQREPESKTMEACKPALLEYLDRLNKKETDEEKQFSEIPPTDKNTNARTPV